MSRSKCKGGPLFEARDNFNSHSWVKNDTSYVLPNPELDTPGLPADMRAELRPYIDGLVVSTYVCTNAECGRTCRLIVSSS